jgi:hypothetical protein
MKTDASNAEAQDRVRNLANGIMTILAGVEAAEAETALSLSVAVAICAFVPNDPAARRQALGGFACQVHDLLQREDIVEWIAASITPAPRAGCA